MEGLSKKEKGFTDMDNSVAMGEGAVQHEGTEW